MNQVPAPILWLAIGAVAVAVFLLWLRSVRQEGNRAPADGAAAAPDTAHPEPTNARARAPGRYRRALVDAGIIEPSAQAGFAAIHAAAPVGGAIGGMWLAAGSEATGMALATMAGLGGWVGWWLPRSWLQSRQTQRRIEMVTEFPIALDLLQIALEGGMGLHAAWAAVATNLSGSRSGLSQEMRRIEVEVGFGTAWADSLADASARTGVPEFRALGSLLEQTERFGTEMAQMIRVMSDSLRHDEIQSIEERAHRASALLLVPLAGLLLPGSLILMFAPTFMLLVEGMSRATP